jgi:hypothetical protein
MNEEATHEFRENDLCPVDGLCASLRFPKMRRSIQRQPQSDQLFLLGSVPMHDICPVNLSRKSERYLGKPASNPVQTLSPGNSGECFPQYPRTRQSEERLADLCRLRYFDSKINKTLVFLTNNFVLPAITIADLYRCRWQVELFFKWIKQHLRIKAFYGTTENAVKTQIGIAISVYVLVAYVKKTLNPGQSLYTILQILSLTLFEKELLYQVLSNIKHTTQEDYPSNQLNLFD